MSRTKFVKSIMIVILVCADRMNCGADQRLSALSGVLE
jgi:hypothetical protein